MINIHVHKLANLLVDEFNKTKECKECKECNNNDDDEVDVNEDEYAVFVQDFAKQHNMKIFGKFHHREKVGTGWTTTSYEFNSDADKLFFLLKYGNEFI